MSNKRKFGALAAMIAAGLSGMMGGDKAALARKKEINHKNNWRKCKSCASFIPGSPCDCEKGKKVGNPLQKACADYTKRKKPLNR